MVHTLIRQLRNRPGDLDRIGIEEAINRHEEPDLVLTAAMTFLASRPELAAMVRTIADRKYENGELRVFELPDRARGFLVDRPGNTVRFLGTLSRPVTMVHIAESAFGRPRDED